jgi:hypothetical protein
VAVAIFDVSLFGQRVAELLRQVCRKRCNDWPGLMYAQGANERPEARSRAFDIRFAPGRRGHRWLSCEKECNERLEHFHAP